MIYQKEDVPVALTAVSRNGTIGFDAWISILANRSRKSFKQRYPRNGQYFLKKRKDILDYTHFQMKFTSSQNDVFSSLLLEGFDTWVGLTKEL